MTLICIVRGVATLSAASPAAAADSNGGSTGYFRIGDGRSRGGPQACYGLAGNTMKYRLGNECDLYGEAEYFHDLPGATPAFRFTGHIMPTYYASDPEGHQSSLRLGQLYVETGKQPLLGGARFWLGKRYYERPDIHMLDLKYVRLDGTGAGIEGVQVYGLKLGYAVFKDNDGGGSTAIRNNLLVQDLPVDPDGHLDIIASVITADGGAGNHDGWNLSLVHRQRAVLGGENVFAIQAGVGPGSGQGNPDAQDRTFGGGGSGGDALGPSGSTLNGSDVRRLRIFDSIWIQPTPNASGSAVVLVQKDRATIYGGTQNWVSLGVRPVWALAPHVKLQAEIGSDWVLRPQGEPTEQLNKFSLVPTLALDRKFWARPELRVFVTRAWWNQAAAPTLAPPGGSRLNATSFGIQVEEWW